MKSVFPESIRSLPQADIPLEELTPYLSQADTHQILYMQFEKTVDLPEYFHNDQIGFVLEGIELTIGGVKHTFVKGDRCPIPNGVKHSGKIYAGYSGITISATLHTSHNDSIYQRIIRANSKQYDYPNRYA